VQNLFTDLIRSCITSFVAILAFCYPGFSQNGPGVSHTIFLLGDCGEHYVNSDPLGDVLRKKISTAKSEVTVLYLGDNVYPKGLAFEGERLRKEGETVLDYQVQWVRGLSARTYFVPGNHDWHHWGRKGFEYIGNQQRWIDSLKDERITMLPRDGCPGPVEILLDEHNVLVILDTQWLLHQWEKPGEESSCDAKTTADVLAQINDIFTRQRNKRVIIAAHHPLITYGEHGGVFPIQAHIFPLAELSHYIYVPLPVIGSIYPLYRKWFGHIQDTSHPTYRKWGEGIQAIMAHHPGSVYVAGHEHALQYIAKDSSHFIVSGTGAKTEYIRQKRHAVFARDVRGFVQMDLHDDGSATLRYFQVDEDHPDGKEIFTTSLIQKTKITPATLPVTFPRDQVAVVNASDQYKAGKTKEFFLGANYRTTWAQHIRVPYFDIGSEMGGLKILQRGGGMQTLSLRLEDSSGHEFVIRSVEKYPEHAVPEPLRKTFAQDLVQDQISASHPYAALVIPRLAKAIGIYHTNPKLVYIPDDPRFGEYKDLFSNSLAIFEERPAGDWSQASHFGNSSKIINTAKVLEKLADDNDNQVDQPFVLKSRLFDLIIGDWDRHDDQWRWASFKHKKSETFQPIPRDRDQAFFVNEGKLSKLWSRKWALPKFEGFDEAIDWVPGLSFNARYFDRTFLTGLSREQWIQSAESLRGDLTDKAIEDAITQWPREIYQLEGDKIISALKSRRDRIVTDALSLYSFLAKEVDVAGSDKAEQFEIRRLPGGDLQVKMLKLGRGADPGKVLFDRVFKADETKEVRLYGLGGNDKFNISGEGRNPMLVRIIGGPGADTLTDQSVVRKRRTFYYDQHAHGAVKGRGKIIEKRAVNGEVNEYDRKSFQYDRFAPLIYGNYNPDDGFFVGGGFIAVKHGFRKDPFAQRHIFVSSVAPLTLSFNFRYQSRYTAVIGEWDLDIDLNLKSPNYVNNFFGLGNETRFNKDIEEPPGLEIDDPVDYYRFRFEEVLADISFLRKFSNWGIFRIGPSLQRVEMEQPGSDEFRYISDFASTLPKKLFDEYHAYGGVSWQIGIDKRDNPKLTSRGVTFSVNGKNMTALNRDASSFSAYESALALYYRFRVPRRVMIAVRTAGGTNTGKYAFYQAQILDGKTELRGYRKTRFYGDTKFYNNAEVRLTLTNFKSYIFPATVGLLAFHDIGRVWYNDATGTDPSAADGQSHVWHRGWGGGIWFTPFNAAVLTTEAGHSKEGTLVYLRLGFLF